jgi:hypothetical protein
MLIKDSLKIAALLALATYFSSQHSIQAADNPLRAAAAEDRTITTIIGPEIDSVVSHATFTLPDGDDTSSVLRTEEVPAELIVPTNPGPANSGVPVPAPLITSDTVTGPMIGEIIGETTFRSLCGSRLGICADGCLIPCPTIDWNRFTFFAGINSFTGPLNRGGAASFGFTEGFNFGKGFNDLGRGELSAQFGLRGTQTNLSGSETTTSDRKQLFLTTGLFHRADWGLQGGAVVDYMHDDWNYNLDLLQVRAEISWKFPEVHEIGFWMALDADHGDSHTSVGKTNPSIIDESWYSVDVYTFFIRNTNPETGVMTRLMGGFTGNKDGILGLQLRSPINENWALDANATYLIPEEGSETDGFREESWNVGFDLVFFPGCKTPYDLDYNSPLFDVGSNGNFFVDRR